VLAFVQQTGISLLSGFISTRWDQNHSNDCYNSGHT